MLIGRWFATSILLAICSTPAVLYSVARFQSAPSRFQEACISSSGTFILSGLQLIFAIIFLFGIAAIWVPLPEQRRP